jgi:hypothetical protein
MLIGDLLLRSAQEGHGDRRWFGRFLRTMTGSRRAISSLRKMLFGEFVPLSYFLLRAAWCDRCNVRRKASKVFFICAAL